jgi:hypothetical protein
MQLHAAASGRPFSLHYWKLRRLAPGERNLLQCQQLLENGFKLFAIFLDSGKGRFEVKVLSWNSIFRGRLHCTRFENQAGQF